MSIFKGAICTSLAALALSAAPVSAQTANNPPPPSPLVTPPAPAPANPNVSGSGSSNQPTGQRGHRRRSRGAAGQSSGGPPSPQGN